MYHLRRIKVLLVTYLLASASLWAQDTMISLANATANATSEQGGNEAASSVIDGNYGKIWHSQWSWGAVFDSKSSVDLTIALSEVTLVDYVRYIPRQDQNNGRWDEVEVFYSPNITGTNFISIGTFNLNYADIPHDFFLNGTEGVSCGQIKFTIRSGSNNHASAAEIEMYQIDKTKLNAFAQCFSDAVYTELKPGVTSSSIADADVRALVQSMQSDPTSYKKFRVGEYEAYETIWTLQQRLKTKNPYSRYENPTGVYFTAGQSYLVAVSGIEDDAVGLKVKNWYLSESSSTYSLRNGLNYITATTEGNVFVNYYTDNYAEAPKVKVHFINAPVIGYWDQETMTNSDWVALLADKASDDHRIIITQSEHAQTAFPISAWKAHCPTDVETLMGHYQDVQWAIRDMMGLEKYGYQTRNRQLFYVVAGGFMAAGAEGAYCDYADLGGIMNANSFDFWGVGHEWGHNNQIDPGFHWSGCGETTNNIYASWAQYHFTASRDAAGNPYNLRLEDEVTGIDEYASMRGGRMQVYFEEALRKGVAWQLQDGYDYHNVTPGTITVTGRDADGNDIGQVTTTSRNYDHFVKLSPFWQLNLWGNLAGKCPDIITDVIHSIRTAENYTATYNTNGKQQINWMKLACDHAGIDLLPFFEKAGMLIPIHAYIEDYGAGWNIITEEMINELKAYVAQKGYPAYTEEINYINAHNMHIYRDNLKLNVTGMQGELNGDKLIVQHSVAQNAVAFETYNAQDELIRITMYGLGSNDEHSFTQVLFPSDAAYVMAVGYDGERQMVYKVRDNQELQALITQTQALIAEVGTVSDEYVAQEVELFADNYYCNALYTAEDNDDKFTSYEVLRDGNPSTYLHTDYSGNAPSEYHYVRIDLGSGNELTFFNLNYRTREDDYVCAPTKVTIEASNDDKTWVTLREVTSGLNTGNNQVNTIAELGDGTPYRYIRMKVLETSTKTRYFVLSEMGLEDLVYNVDLNDGYSEISTRAVVAAYKAVQAAQEEIDGGKDYTHAYNELLNKYNALIAARDEMGQLDELRAPLLELIARTESLINSCGTVTYVPATPDTELALQANNSANSWYVSSNADHNTGTADPDGGGILALVDGDYNTYFHTRWGGGEIYEPHYIQVDMGQGKTIQEFVFSYTPRYGSPAPTAMTIYGSNDASSFTQVLAEITSGLPAHDSGNSYTSSTINSDGAAYRYLRFVVTGSAGPGNAQYGGQYFFGMLEFDITEKAKPEGYTVTLGNEAGDVTEQLLLTAYKAVQEAQSVVDYANTEAQVNEAIEKLQAQYQALEDAKNSVVYVEYTISTNVAGGGVIYKDQPYTTTLTAPNTLTQSELIAIEVEGYEAVSVVVEGTAITVTYNKGYTVEVIGGKGNGGVTYNGQNYANGETIYAPASFATSDLTAIVPDGYTLKDISIEDATVKISFSAIPLVDVTKYYTLVCRATDHDAYIRDNGSVINGRSAEGSLFQFVAADDDNGYYIKSYVTDSYLNYDGANVSVGTEASTIWTMASHSTGAMTLTIGNDQYLNNNGSADAACPYLQLKEHDGGPASGNACSLWTITEGTPLDKSALRELIDATNALVISCYQGGNVDGELIYLGSLHVTLELMASTKSIIADAEEKYNSKATTSNEYNTILTALQAAGTTLANAKSSAEVEAAERNEKRNTLNTLITDANDLISLCETTPGDATQALIDEVSAAVTSAQAVAEYMGSTVEQLTNATTTLQGLYNVLLAAQQSTAKTELRALIEQTTALIEQCGTVSYGVQTIETPIKLQYSDATANGYLSTNADQNVVGNGTDGGGIAALRDGSVETYMHTQWGGDAVDDDHYVQVSLGAGQGLAEFVFTYATRYKDDPRYNSPAPSVIEVYGSNDGSDFTTLLGTFRASDTENPLPGYRDAGEYWTSATIAPEQTYDYLRFYVRESSGPGNTQHGDHYFFAMSEFALTAIAHETNYHAELLNNNVTAEQLIEVYQANAAAATFADNSAVQADLLAEKTKLQALYDALLEAATSVLLPVTLTTDANAPVLYVIKTKRGGDPVLQYDEASDMFSVTAAVAGRATQAFYFMKGDKAADGTQQVFIYPYMAPGKVLAANDVNDGHSKALAIEKGTAKYEQWVFVEQADGYYNLQPAGTSTYLSNYGGTDNKMGFYSTDPSGDTGSLLKFETTTVEGGYYYLKLKDYYETQAKVASSDIQGGTAVGYYPEDKATAYNAAYAAATDALANKVSETECQTVYNNLVAANEALELIMPTEGKYYRFVSVVKGDGSNAYVYANPTDNKMYWAEGKAANDATTMWSFVPTADGKLAVTNLHTGSSINTFIGYNPTSLSETAGEVSIVSLSANDGQIGIKCGDRMMHAQSDGAVVHWDTGANDGSAWRIVEVTNEKLSLVEFALKIGQYRHAGLYLNYAAEIPENVKVYIAHTPDGADGSIIAEELEGTILPARTAVIVKGDAATYSFKYTSEDYDGSDDLSVNLLGGSAYLKYQQVKAEGNRCCVFGQKSGVVGLYKNYVEYTDAMGSQVGSDKNSVADSDNGTHFKVSANKIYYEYKPSAVAGASAFRFRFSSKEEGTTTIDELLMQDETIIYNLYGQRLTEIVVPGVYIVNGKKMYVSEKMIGNNK